MSIKKSVVLQRAPWVWWLEVKPYGKVSLVKQGAFAWVTKLSPKAQKILKVVQSKSWFAKPKQHSKCVSNCSLITRTCKQDFTWFHI